MLDLGGDAHEAPYSITEMSAWKWSPCRETGLLQVHTTDVHSEKPTHHPPLEDLNLQGTFCGFGICCPPRCKGHSIRVMTLFPAVFLNLIKY